MSESNRSTISSSGRIGVPGLLGITFVVLKLCGVINWPWLWVLAPFWIPLTIVLVVLLGFGGFLMLRNNR